MKRFFLKDISASATQVIFNQAMGLLVFLITSRYLVKTEYGELNWSLALITFATTVLSLRLEQIVVRKVAAGEDPSKMLTLFTGHIVFSGLLFYGLLLLANLLFASFFKEHDILLILAVSQVLLFFSLPFKQIANGKEAFKPLALMSSVSNFIKAVCLLGVILFSTLTIHQVLYIYIVASLLELITAFYITEYKLKIPLGSQWLIKDYFALLRESLPQIGAVFLNACMARFDWILLGIFSTTIITAEYSFAYRVFELCPIPMLILGPVLLSRFSKYFSRNSETDLPGKRKEIGLYMRYAMLAATFIPLILNIIWTPLIGALTNDKYGEVNKASFFILSLCIPFQYLTNLLWTIEFSQNRLKRILRVTVVVCLIIVVGDLFMIPLMNAKGAAIVYLLATILESVLYLHSSILIRIKECWQSVFIYTAIALVSGLTVELIDVSVYLKLALAVVVYALLVFITKQVKKEDLIMIKELRN